MENKKNIKDTKKNNKLNEADLEKVNGGVGVILAPEFKAADGTTVVKNTNDGGYTKGSSEDK